jgi:hypothetical protein
MWKAVLAGTAALAIAGSTLVYAQQRGDRPEGFRRGAPTADEMRAFGNARLAALRAGLALTPEQQVNWPAYEEAAREMQKLRMERMIGLMERRNNPQPQNSDPAERLRRQGTLLADTGVAMKRLADAVEPLYKSLDDNQKRRFAALGRIGDPRESFAARDDDRRDARGRDDRGGRDFRSGRDFGGRDFRDRRDFRGERDFRDRSGFRDDRRGGRDGRDFRDDRFGRDFRDDRDFRGPRNFRGRDDDRGFRDRDDGRRGDRSGNERNARGDDRDGPRAGDEAGPQDRRPYGGRRFGREP